MVGIGMEFQPPQCPQVKACLICDKKLVKHTHPETKSAASYFAKTLTNVFSFEPRFYQGELTTNGTSASALPSISGQHDLSEDEPGGPGLSSTNGQNKNDILWNELMKMVYCYKCVRNIRSISEVLKKIERLEQKVIDYKFEIANQFVDFTSNQQHVYFNDFKAFTAANDSQDQQLLLKDDKPNIIGDDLLKFVRTEVIQGFNFVDFRERYTNSRPALIKTEDKEPYSSLSTNAIELHLQGETVSPITKDIRINLTRIEEIPELSKYIIKPEIEEEEVIKLKLIDPVTKQEVQMEIRNITDETSENGGGNVDYCLENSFPDSPYEEDTDYVPDAVIDSENSESDLNYKPSEILQTIMNVKEDQDVQVRDSEALKSSIAKAISCEFCSAQVSTYSGLSQHKRKLHGSNLHMCIRCGEEFPTENELRIHRSSHTVQLLKPLKTGELYRCPSQDCKFCSKTKQIVCVHIRQKHKFFDNPATCDICSAEFQTLAGLASHKCAKHGITGNMCTKCGKSFGTESELKKHRITHLKKEEKSFPCTKCSYVATTRHKLTKHLETHDPQRNYICQYCGLGFRSSQVLKYHQGSKHIDLNLQDPDLYKCKICGKVSASPPMLRNHIKQMHFQEQCKFFCDTCGKAFLTVGRFKRHQLSHTDQRNYECEVCHAKFKYPSHLTNHSQRHTGKFRFTCQTCGKEFTNSNSYKRHAQIHAGVLKYICTICGKGFPVHNYLYIHMRSHESNEERKQRLANKKQEPLNKLYNELRVTKKISAAVPLDPNVPAVEEYPMIYDYTRDRTDLRQKREAKARVKKNVNTTTTTGRKKPKAKANTKTKTKTVKAKLESANEDV